MRSIIVGLALIALAACTDEAGNETEQAPEETPTAITCDYPDAEPETTEVVDADRPPTEPRWAGTVDATVHTGAGTIGLELDADHAPCAVNAIGTLADQGFYDDTECHHLSAEEAFFLQCGDPTGTGSGSPGWIFGDELQGDETYEAGTIAMASGGANTNGSQFFLVYEDTPFSPAYTVLGTVDDAGLDVLRTVSASGIRPEFVGAEITPPALPVVIESFILDDER